MMILPGNIQWSDCLETLATRPLHLLLQQGPQAQHTIECLGQIHNLYVAYTAPLTALTTFVHSSKVGSLASVQLPGL